MKGDRSKASRLRRLIKRGTVVMPGAFNASLAMLIEQCGFDGLYISGAGLSASLGYPDIGLLTMSEVVEQTRYITNAVGIPVIADADTGYGEPLNVRRAVMEFERAGVAGIHIEDQRLPKRCGHLPGKELITIEAMVQKIVAAVEARRDPDFLIIARTDARGCNGLEDAIERAHRYIEAGADMVFPEALESVEEFSRFAKEVKAPLMANMTEFGKTPYISVSGFKEMGYSIVLFPMTAFRVMMKGAQEVLKELKDKGSVEGFLHRMQTREELYNLLRYRDYERVDKRVARVFKRGSE